MTSLTLAIDCAPGNRAQASLAQRVHEMLKRMRACEQESKLKTVSKSFGEWTFTIPLLTCSPALKAEAEAAIYLVLKNAYDERTIRYAEYAFNS